MRRGDARGDARVTNRVERFDPSTKQDPARVTKVTNFSRIRLNARACVRACARVRHKINSFVTFVTQGVLRLRERVKTGDEPAYFVRHPFVTFVTHGGPR